MSEPLWCNVRRHYCRCHDFYRRCEDFDDAREELDKAAEKFMEEMGEPESPPQRDGVKNG
jgi:hypothetical protein